MLLVPLTTLSTKQMSSNSSLVQEPPFVVIAEPLFPVALIVVEAPFAVSPQYNCTVLVLK